MQNWIEEQLHVLNLVDSMEQEQGFTRLGYSAREGEAINQFERIAEELGLTVRCDSAGNVMASWTGSDPDLPVVATGSHLDTVHQGGGYDGVAGVLCSLAAVKQLKEEGFQPKHTIEVINFRSEESARFGISTIGSKAMSGQLDPTIGSVCDGEGISIEQAVNECGFNWERFQHAERGEDELKSFVELHIEQGTHIEESGAHYGVVNAIACPIRLKVVVKGKAGHTGTTPMNKRQDAFVAIAPLVNFANETAKKLNEENSEAVVATVSTVDLAPNSMNVIPGEVELGIDIRSVRDDLKETVASEIYHKCKEIEGESHVTIEVETLVNNASVLLDEQMQTSLKAISDEVGMKSIVMSSGAGHDVMNMQSKWPSGLIFIPCEDGLSHHPEEFSSLEDLLNGTKVLANYLKTEAGE
ncbi:M20 family metallo-hydrolase [Alkalibacillus aidingensis]|uniref:M20 family metallo-hydrolase n=1 Tax=Alkalibacillus aidingensis TaxID=2747607 RepID=UPI001660C3FA|nr:M20 family metallo-hydrolase [Alkalibacillus aidingensis]